MIRKCITYLTICALVLAGCKASCEERVFVRCDSAKPLPMRTSPYNARYRLYAQTTGTPTTRTATPLLAYSLPKGSRLGFERDAEQRLLAVAGEARTLLDPAVGGKAEQPQNGYTWTMQPDPDQVDPLKTTLLIVGLVGAAAGIAIGAAAASAGPSLALAASAP